MSSVRFRTEEITALLRQQAADPSDNELEGSAAVKATCDVTYALFLEPREDADPAWSTMEWLADVAIRKFSPSPVLIHTELVIPPIPDSGGGKVHFATYLGRGGADWQNMRSKEDGISFYLIENGSRWRAIPIFGTNAASETRKAAESNLHAPYSVSMYATSTPPLRSFSKLISDAPMHMGHCATIAARVLKQAGLGSALRHVSPYYSPSTLYIDLNASLGQTLAPEDKSNLTTVAPGECEQTIATLLRAPLSYATVRGLGDAKCIDAVRALTLRVCATGESGDPMASRIAQKQLASALLRWCLLREDGPPGGAESVGAVTPEPELEPATELV